MHSTDFYYMKYMSQEFSFPYAERSTNINLYQILVNEYRMFRIVAYHGIAVVNLFPLYVKKLQLLL